MPIPLLLADWRLARLTRVEMHTEPVGPNFPYTLKGNKDRIGVQVYANHDTIANQDILITSFTPTQQITTQTFFESFGISIISHGLLPSHEMVFTYLNLDSEALFIEYFISESYLTAGEQQIKRELGIWAR